MKIFLNENTFTRNNDLPVFLFTLSHPELPESIRFTSDNLDLLGYETNAEYEGSPIYGFRSSAGEEQENNYYYIPLKIVFPSQNSEEPEYGSIEISNVKRTLVPFVRRFNMANGYAMLKIVLIQYDGTEESRHIALKTLTNIEIKNITYTSETMSFEMSPFTLMNEPFPADSFTPSMFPALFKAVG